VLAIRYCESGPGGKKAILKRLPGACNDEKGGTLQGVLEQQPGQSPQKFQLNIWREKW